MTQAIPFQVNHEGKCATCLEQKPLDSMVRENYRKGRYHCTDCKTIDEAERYTDDEHKITIVPPSRLQKLMRFAFG